MFDAIDIARYLVRLGYDPACPEESVWLSPLRLQKLLYYSQGWSLALLDRPLFRQPLEAWTWGPVVVDVYDRFKGTREGITPLQAGELTVHLPEDVAGLVEMVWSEYGRYTPPQLVETTHHEPPWLEARNGLPAEAKSSTPLSPETMARYFREQAKSRGRHAVPSGFPAIDPVAAWKAEQGIAAGSPGIDAGEAFSELLAEAGE